MRGRTEWLNSNGLLILSLGCSTFVLPEFTKGSGRYNSRPTFPHAQGPSVK